MTFLPPEGFVDPSDEQEVAVVLRGVLRTFGIPGLGDLLGRIPGSKGEPARPAGMFRRAVPATLWLSPQHQLLLSDPVVHVHVVGGVVLAREPLPPGRLPEAVARLIVSVVADAGNESEASVVLTAARESSERLQP